MARPRKIVSGGQSGVDRAALDVAREHGIAIGGWCPRGGWAEDMTEPPGLLAIYPELKETPLGDLAQRTEWNARDSDRTLILISDRAEMEGGTELTRVLAARYKRPCLVVVMDESGVAGKVSAWLAEDENLILNVAGPRESKSPGVYSKAHELLSGVLV